MPTGAEGTTVLEGSTKNATAKGTRVTVTGPFAAWRDAAPDCVPFRFAGQSRDDRAHRFPLPLDAVSLAVQKIGDMHRHFAAGGAYAGDADRRGRYSSWARDRDWRPARRS